MLLVLRSQRPCPIPTACIEASGGVAKYLYEAGIDRVLFALASSPADELLIGLDDMAQLIE